MTSAWPATDAEPERLPWVRRIIPIGAYSEQIRLDALARRNGAPLIVPPTNLGFTVVDEDHYRMKFPNQVSFDLSRLKHDRSSLRGQFIVLCERRGPRGRGLEITGEFNVDSLRSRSEWLRSIIERAAAVQLDDTDWWPEHDFWAMLQNFCKQVRQAARDWGESGIADLRTVPPTTADRIAELQGLHVPLDHSGVLFADGGSAKTLFAVFVLGLLTRLGLRCGIVDWEMDAAIHSARLKLLFPTNTPLISYLRCAKPLVDEADRINRFLRENGITFTLYDSIAKACDGPPEAAETAGRYQRVVRQLGGGSMHIAHITKKGEDQKPFGSGFWHNDCRASWFMKSLPDLLDETVLHTIIYNRKATQGALAQPIGFAITFGKDSIDFTPEEADDGKVRKPTVRGRMIALLRLGPLSAAEIAGKIGATAETVKRTARRYDEVFTIGPDGTIGLNQSTAWMVKG